MWYVALSGRNARSGTRNPRRCRWAGVYQAYSLAEYSSVVSAPEYFYIKNVLIHYYIYARKIIPLQVLKYRPYYIAGAVADWYKNIPEMPGIVGARGQTRP
jgi:hypothetical protein